jgi:hypothetical protein
MPNTIIETASLLPDDKKSKTEKESSWIMLPSLIRSVIENLLSDDYLIKRKIKSVFTIKNPWGIPPSKKNIDWLLSNRSKHCKVSISKSTTLV